MSVSDASAAVLPDLVCPEHGKTLTSGPGRLACRAGCSFEVTNGIPRFVPTSTYADAFGEQWHAYRRTQLDSHTGHPISESRLRRCVGEELWGRLGRCTVLEAGCGAGRFTEVLLARGASVFSIDLSRAVDANQQSFPQSPRHRLAQADILKLPFASGSFDVVMCLGVVQHTPDPERTIERLWRHVKPGGYLVFDHYRFQMAYYLKLLPVYRAIVKRLPSRVAMPVSNSLVNLFLPAHRALRHSRIGRALLGRISPVMEYYSMIPELDDRQQREWALLDTHDALTDWYKHLRTKDQILAKLRTMQGEDIWCENGGNGVEARMRRPLVPQTAAQADKKELDTGLRAVGGRIGS